MTFNGDMRVLAGAVPPDAVLGLLVPAWQLLIGVAVLLATVGAGIRIARRGRSRMRTALAIWALAIVGLAVLGLVVT